MAEKMTVFVMLIFMLLPFAGCGNQYWYSREKSFAQCKVDCMDCRVKAGQYVENTGEIPKYSIKLEKQCMYKKGYHLVSGSGLSEDIKRRNPDIVFKETYGIAGHLECDMTKNRKTQK